MGFLCKDNNGPTLLSSSSIGRISQCECCDSYHVVIGNITLRMERKHLISLTQMIIDALETKSAYENDNTEYYMRTQA